MSQMYMSLGLAVLGSATYHIFQKAIPHSIHPALVLMATYAMAFVGSAAILLFFPLENSWRAELRALSPLALMPGLCIIGIEGGFLLAYRVGWNINIAPLLVNMTVALLLIPIGLALYHESLSLVKLAGVGVCLVGLVLVNWS